MNSKGRFSYPGQHQLPWFIALIWLPFLLLGCESSTTPETQDPPDEDEYTLIDSWTVGPAGRSLVGEDFKIDIPAGALAADVEVKLYGSRTDLPFGENSNTEVFQLEGITEHSEPIRVALRYSGTLPDFPYVAHGAEHATPYDQETAVDYDLIAAADSSGFLVVHLPPNASHGFNKDRSPAEISNLQFLLGLMNYGEPMMGEYFIVHYPGTVADPEAIEAFMIELRSIIVDDLNLDFECAENEFNLDWPIDVLVRPLAGEDQDRPTTLTFRTRPKCTITLNETFLENGSLDLPVSAGQDLLYIALLVESYWSRLILQSTQRGWFHWAIYDWAEEWFTVDNNFVRPSAIDGNEFAMFPGIQAWGVYCPFGNQIPAMSAFIKFLTATYGTAAPGTIIEDTPKIDLILDTIATSTGTLTGQIWREFCVQYLSGSIYDMNQQLVVQHVSSQDPSLNWTNQGPEDLAHDFNGTSALQEYGGLEAKIFSINFNSQGFSSTSNLRLTTNHQSEHDDIPMQVFGVTDEGLVQLGDNVTELKLRLQDQLFSQGINQVIILLVNEDFDPTSPTSIYTRDFLRCQIVEEYNYPSLYVRIFVDATVYNQDEGANEVLGLFGYYNQWLTGNFDGDEFEYTEYFSDGSYWKRTTATGQVDLATGEMLDFVIETNSESYSGGILVAWEHRKFDLVSGMSPGFGYELPMIAIGGGYVCSQIESMEFSSQTYSYVSHTCSAESYIRLEWH